MWGYYQHYFSQSSQMSQRWRRRRRRVLTRDELLYLWSIWAFVTVMNDRVGYSGEVAHIASSATTFRPKTHQYIITDHRSPNYSEAWPAARQRSKGLIMVLSLRVIDEDIWKRAKHSLFLLVGAPGLHDSLYKLALLKQLAEENMMTLNAQ